MMFVYGAGGLDRGRSPPGLLGFLPQMTVKMKNIVYLSEN